MRAKPAGSQCSISGAVNSSRCGAADAALESQRNDVLLAATAVSYDATVLTSNVQDFKLVARFLDVRYRAPV